MACEDLLLNSIRKAKSGSRAEPKAPKQARNFLRIFTINTYLKKKKNNFSHPYFVRCFPFPLMLSFDLVC